MTLVMRTSPVLEVDIDATSPTPRISVIGRCTGPHAAALLSALRAACRAHPRRIIVDLNGADEIDGEAMAALLEFRRDVIDTVITIDIHAVSGPRLMALMADAEEFAA
jgi:ABC-type transporter Mla MlaB component